LAALAAPAAPTENRTMATLALSFYYYPRSLIENHEFTSNFHIGVLEKGAANLR